MTGEVRLDDGKYGQTAFRTQENRKIRPSVGLGRDAVLLAVERWNDFPEFGGYPGNVGLYVPPASQWLARDPLPGPGMRPVPNVPGAFKIITPTNSIYYL